MKSFIAALRSLTLPFGAPSTSPRIVLDGVAGQISIYGAGGVLLMTLNSSGFIVYDVTANQRTKIGIPGQFSAIALGTGDASETSRPVIDSQALSSGPLFTLQGGDWGKGFLVSSLFSPKTNADRAFWQIVTGFLTGGLTPPFIDLCGDIANPARTLLDDLWFGSGLGNGNAPSPIRRIGQGLIPGSTSGILTGNVTGSATNGTVTDIVALLDVPIRTGWIYRVEAHGYTGVTSGNLSVTSQWEIDLDVDDNGGGRTDVAGFKFNANSTGDIRIGIPAIVGEFTASADGTADIRAAMVKNTGTAAATFAVQNDANHPFTIRCYHVG